MLRQCAPVIPTTQYLATSPTHRLGWGRLFPTNRCFQFTHNPLSAGRRSVVDLTKGSAKRHAANIATYAPDAMASTLKRSAHRVSHHTARIGVALPTGLFLMAPPPCLVPPTRWITVCGSNQGNYVNKFPDSIYNYMAGYWTLIANDNIISL